MTEHSYRLPPTLAGDIDAYEHDVKRFLAGDLTNDIMKARRVPCGVYEQRQDCTYMVRVRVAGGVLPADQARQLAALAREYGNGLLHVTTRQDVQLHDIDLGDTPAIMRRLVDAGLTSRGGGGNTVRNVAACPYAGVCPHERFDVTPFALAVTGYLIALVGSYNLPRKYKIAFSGCAADCALARVVDLGFVAETRDGQPGFRVFAGGGMGAKSRVADELLDWTPVSECIRIAEAVRRLFDRHGDRENRSRARLRYVFERLGVDAVREEFERIRTEVVNDGVPAWDGECEVASASTPPGSGAPVFESIDGVQCLRQRQPELVAVPLHLPLGFLTADDFEKAGRVAARFSNENGLRTTRQQNLAIRGVHESDLISLAQELNALETPVLAPDPLAVFTACAGAATCRLGLCLARDVARACAEEMKKAPVSQEILKAFPVYVNGCPNACGQQPVGPVGLFGVAQRHGGRLVPSYRVTLGGHCDADGTRLGADYGQVPARAVPALIAELAEDFQDNRSGQESFVAYHDRTGREHFARFIAKHAAVPDYETSPEFYRDFGADEDFSLAGRGAGECGAGVFEVIQKDLAAAHDTRDLFEATLHAARALLITRGVDAQEADVVFREFETHFIDRDLVPERFRALLTRARGRAQGWEHALNGSEEEVESLLKHVEMLYSTLDSSLQFHPQTPETAKAEGERGNENAESAKPVEFDLSGVPCPLNFVKAKLKLEDMHVGERLAIVLDDGEPAENVPASFRNEGQSVEELTNLGDGHWRVVVKKEHA